MRFTFFLTGLFILSIPLLISGCGYPGDLYLPGSANKPRARFIINPKLNATPAPAATPSSANTLPSSPSALPSLPKSH